MVKLEVEPTLTAEQLKAIRHKLLTSAHGKLIQHNAKIFCEGELKAVYLTNEIDNLYCLTALHALKKLRFNASKDSTRPMIKQTLIGGEMLLGWLRPRCPSREDWLRRSNRDQLFQAWGLEVLVRDMELAMRRYLPEYYRNVHKPAAEMLRPPDQRFKTLHKVTDPDQRKCLELLDETPYYHFGGNHLFSTITLNHNLVFGAHPDGANVPGTLSCITALGNFDGGVLCFPRLNVAFNLRPGDLLIADTNREYHGTVGGIVGDRYSVVAYLHKSLLPKR